MTKNVNNSQDSELFFLLPESFQNQSVSGHSVHALSDWLPKSTSDYSCWWDKAQAQKNLKKQKLMLKTKTGVRLEIQLFLDLQRGYLPINPRKIENNINQIHLTSQTSQLSLAYRKLGSEHSQKQSSNIKLIL